MKKKPKRQRANRPSRKKPNHAPYSLDEIRALVEQLTMLASKPADPRERVTVKEVIARYLDEAKEEVCVGHYGEKVRILTLFANEFGEQKVVDGTPLQIQDWIRGHPSWASRHTRQNANRILQRAFNWSVGVRLTLGNPFRGARTFGRVEERRPMSDEDFQSLLRSSEPYFRRLITFLKFTGCRPGEASCLRWSQVDWQRCLAILQEHKTARKTGKPRVLFLTPPVMKMLAYLRRNPFIKGKWYRAAHTLYLILQDGPLSFHEVAERMPRYTFRAIRKARLLIGANYHRVGFGKGANFIYELPKDAQGDEKEFVFLNSIGRRWRTSTIAQYLKVLRRRTGVSKKVSLHLLRHRFITNVVKAGVSLKVAAELAGHSNTLTTETYTHVSNDVGLLLQAAQKANGQANGNGRMTVEGRAAP